MEDPFRRPTFGSALFYKDPFAALDFLEKAFGFERTMVITDAEGNLGHAEMRFGDGYLMLGQEWADYTASPASRQVGVAPPMTLGMVELVKSGLPGSSRSGE